jgi:hypothetical protein
MQRRSMLLASAAIMALALPQLAFADFVETWETPPVAAGATSTTLPAPWVRFSGGVSNSQIWHPNSTANFNQVQPLAGPAGGNQLLFLNGTNTGIHRLSGVIIQANTTYELSAAIGNDMQTANTQFWSLQLWADTNNSGVFEGSVADTFIGQQFGTNAGAVNPAEGDWALNSFSFNSAGTPGLVGKELVVFLNNFNNGRSFYDNVSLQTVVQPVPEPASLALLGLTALGGLGVRQRHREST